MVSCGKWTKIIFILLNFFLMLTGLALVALGSYLIQSKMSLSFFTGSNFFSGAILIIISGITVFFTTGLGIFGVLRQRRVLLAVYLVTLLIAIILEFVAGTLGFVYRNGVTDIASKRAVLAILKYRDYYSENYNPGVNAAVDLVQSKFGCCGWNDTTIWEYTQYFSEVSLYPESCECSMDTYFYNFYYECAESSTGQFIYNRTCNTRLTGSIARNVLLLSVVGIVFGAFQVLPVVLVIVVLVIVHRAINAYIEV